METGKLSRCTEQNSGWGHSYTHLVLGYTSHWKTTKTRGTDIKAVAEEKLLTEMCQSSLLSFIPNPNLAPQKSQMSQQAKKQLFPMFKLCRHRQRANTPTDLHPEQGIAALCTTLTSALPPLSVNSHLTTPFQAPWTEGKPHPLPGDVQGAGTGAAELSEHRSQPTHPLVLTNSPLIWPHPQIKLNHYIETNPKY